MLCYIGCYMFCFSTCYVILVTICAIIVPSLYVMILNLLLLMLGVLKRSLLVFCQCVLQSPRCFICCCYILCLLLHISLYFVMFLV